MNGRPFPGPGMYPMPPMYPHPMPPMPHRHHHGHGFCSACCHPVAQCVCHRNCRKIEKELLVQPAKAAGTAGTTGDVATNLTHLNIVGEAAQTKLSAMMVLSSPVETGKTDEKTGESVLVSGQIQKLRALVARQQVAYNILGTIIGGGCCVHLSIEYMPVTPLIDLPAFSGVLVLDSDSTVLAWGKYFVGDGYHVKECIVSTNPGAHLWVASINSITRVRWCEVISC